jgi:hypothetical protein
MKNNINTCNSDLFDCKNVVEENHLCLNCTNIKQDLDQNFKDYIIYEKSGITTFFWQPLKEIENESWASFQTDKPFTLDSLAESLLKKHKIEVDAHCYINPKLDFISQINYTSNNK